MKTLLLKTVNLQTSLSKISKIGNGFIHKRRIILYSEQIKSFCLVVKKSFHSLGKGKLEFTMCNLVVWSTNFMNSWYCGQEDNVHVVALTHQGLGALVVGFQVTVHETGVAVGTTL